MIVDKKNNLNIYKEDTRKVGKDNETSESSCCSSTDTEITQDARVTSSACCGSTQNSSKLVEPKADTGSCCSTSSAKAKERAKNIINIDFNDWVGK